MIKLLQLIHETENVKAEFDTDVPCIILTAKDFTDSNDVRKTFTKAIDFYMDNIGDYPNISWLNDMRGLKTARPMDVRWIDKNVNDRASVLGKRKTAFILPEDRLGRFAVDTYISFTNMRPNNNLVFKSFNTVDEAKTWLKEPLAKG